MQFACRSGSHYAVIIHVWFSLCSYHICLVLVMQLSYMSDSRYAVIIHVWLSLCSYHAYVWFSLCSYHTCLVLIMQLSYMSGYRYAVIISVWFQGFFKRSITRGDKYKCFFGGECDLTPKNRNRCKSCRFKRCLDTGMAVEGRNKMIFSVQFYVFCLSH